MQNSKAKLFFLVLLFGLLLLPGWSKAGVNRLIDGFSTIIIKVSQTQGVPKASSIDATIDGHTLSIVFLENLGQVTIDVSLVAGGEVETQSTPTPNGVIIYIPNTGSYVVTFTLSNGDVYYGEFEVTD